jgi:hypothetical protein
MAWARALYLPAYVSSMLNPWHRKAQALQPLSRWGRCCGRHKCGACLYVLRVHACQCMQGRQRAHNTRLSGMIILCMAWTPPQQPAPPASQSPIRKGMARREFSHGTWHRVHTYYAGTVHARATAGAEYAAQRDAHTVHGGDPVTAARATCQPVITSKDGHVMA